MQPDKMDSRLRGNDGIKCGNDRAGDRTAIARVHAREVLDSRGVPTVEVDVHLSSGARGRAIVPSGASTGRHEALEFRDGNPARYQGKGVRHAVRHVNEVLGPAVVGVDATRQHVVDALLLETDGTPNLRRLGGNAVLGVSLATAHAAANSLGLPLYRYLGGSQARELPVPMVNILSGGLHARGIVDFQDFLLIPIGAQSFSEALVMVRNVYHAMGEILTARGASTLVIDERENGLSRRHTVGVDFVEGAEYRALLAHYGEISSLRGPLLVGTRPPTTGADRDGDANASEAGDGNATPAAAVAEAGERLTEIASMEQLVEHFISAGKRGVAINRYKGLGEMNPDQLWTTTMNPEHRTLLQVRAEDDAEADHMFTTLMGDQVEPRRKFIQDNALDVKNLDI